MKKRGEMRREMMNDEIERRGSGQVEEIEGKGRRQDGD
jgi:hypothetical protein